jgi:hypothetical protein
MLSLHILVLGRMLLILIVTLPVLLNASTCDTSRPFTSVAFAFQLKQLFSTHGKFFTVLRSEKAGGLGNPPN